MASAASIDGDSNFSQFTGHDHPGAAQYTVCIFADFEPEAHSNPQDLFLQGSWLVPVVYRSTHLQTFVVLLIDHHEVAVSPVLSFNRVRLNSPTNQYNSE